MTGYRTTKTRPPDRIGLVLAAATVALLAGIVVAALAGLLDHVSLMNRWAAGGCELAGGALLVASWLRPDARWVLRGVPIVLVSVTALVGLIALLLRVTGTVTDPYPPSFAVWVFAAFTAIATAPFAVRRRGEPLRWRSVAALAAVPLTLAGGFMLIVQEYGIWPTVGDVVGHAGVIDGNRAQDYIAGGPKAVPGGVILALDAPSTTSHFHHRKGVVFLPPAYSARIAPICRCS